MYFFPSVLMKSINFCTAAVLSLAQSDDRGERVNIYDYLVCTDFDPLQGAFVNLPLGSGYLMYFGPSTLIKSISF